MDTQLIIEKIKRIIAEIGTELRDFPESKTGRYFENREKCLPIGHIFSWTQSFFCGMAYWAFVETKDMNILKWLYSFKESYYDKVFKTPLETMHDLGFLYIPYAVALYKLTGDDDMKAIVIKAADELAKRFEPKGRYIRAWGRMDYQIPAYVDEKLAQDCFFTQSNGLAIIDCMMNIPLLFIASQITNNKYYERIAKAHADTTMQYFIREDYSVRHAYRFSEESGEAIGEENYCGYGIGSYWARGTAWAIYGFMCCHKYTGDEKYLDLSRKLLKKFAQECGGNMPVWDFRLPENEKKNIDTSAAAIVLSACRYLKQYDHEAEQFSEKLSAELLRYLDTSVETDGLLREQNGREVYASYGDYYLVEAIFSEKYPDAVLW